MQSTIHENDIRPDHIRPEYDACYQSDLKWLWEKSDEFMAAPCPACGGDTRTPLFTKDGFHYHACRTCKTHYISPRPSAALLGKFYPVSQVCKLFRDRIFPASKITRREHIFQPRLRSIVAACVADGIQAPTLVEVGAGFGIFCEEAIRSGFFARVIGVEPNRELADECRGLGISIVEKMIEDVHPDDTGKVDVICSFEVLEHLFHPRDFLNACRKLLQNEGLLFLTCPNGNGFDLSMLGARSDTYNFEHLNYFNPQSIRLLLESSGFRVVDVQTPGKLDVDLVHKAARAGLLDLDTHTFLRRILLDEYETLGPPFQEFLASHQLSGHMSVIAKHVA